MRTKNILTGLMAASTLGLASTAQAQSIYGEIGYMGLDVGARVGGVGISAKPANLRGIIGFDLGPLAIEGMTSVSERDDTVRVGGLNTPIRTKVDNISGVFLKPNLSLGNFEIFGRVGAARTKLSVGGEKASGTSLAYGAGIRFNLTDNLTLGADYMNFYDKDSITVEGVSIGLGLKF